MRRLGVLLARLQVWLRVLVVLAWVGGFAWLVHSLAPISGDGGAVAQIVPKHARAIEAERLSTEKFAFPLITRTVVVVRDPRGLSPSRQASLVGLAASLSAHTQARYEAIGGALLLLNTIGGTPFTREPGTTALLYLFFRPDAGAGTQQRVAADLLRHAIGHRRGEFEGVTGTAVGQHEQNQLIESRLPWVELASLVLVLLATGFYFRSLGASLLTLASVAGAYLVAERVVATAARAAGLELPAEIRPVLVVLVFGVATDYSIFYLSRFRALLSEGHEPRAAAVRVVREITPIVLAAGLTVAAGTAALSVASLRFLRAFGPGLAVAVLVAMVAVITIAPAVLALLGPRIYWPGGMPAKRRGESRGSRLRLAPVRFSTRHPLLAVLLAGALVLACASGLRDISIGNEVVQGLPPGSQAHRAYVQAHRGFIPGALAPAVVVISAPGLDTRRSSLSRLQQQLEQQRGVAAVVGPRQQPLLGRYGVVFSARGGRARYLVYLRDDPLGPAGLADVRELESRLPALLARVGLRGARGLVGGDSALSADVVDSTLGDLGRIAPTMLVAIFLIVALFLRALVAPAYLVLTSLLAALSALGLTAYVLQGAAGYDSVTYYVIFTVAVLLVSLGSDYNVFMVGRIWQEGRRHSVRRAVESAAARAARPISVAGMLLAGTFALLAMVPVRGFREIAFAMAVGLIIDTFVVRTVLVPALIVLFGRRSAWPGSAFDPAARAERSEEGPDAVSVTAERESAG